MLHMEQALDRVDDVVDLGCSVLLQGLCIRHRHISTRHPQGGRIQIVEGGACAQRTLSHDYCALSLLLQHFLRSRMTLVLFRELSEDNPHA